MQARENLSCFTAALPRRIALISELIRRGNPVWHGDVDLDPGNLDVQHVGVHRILHDDSAAQRRLNPFRRLVEQGLSGADIAFWRDCSAVAPHGPQRPSTPSSHAAAPEPACQAAQAIAPQ
jgi:hypothetical protein